MSETPTVPGRAIIVLGMSRTGTSTTMRILNLLGVSLGDEDQLFPAVARMNPKGFYENRAIVALNDELLARLGGSWLAPPSLEPGWEQDRALSAQKEKAREILAQNFSSTALWGLKDPRMCLTFPFWRELIGEADFVVCHRNVLEVVRSLAQRDGLSPKAGFDLWLRHAAAAILNSSGARRMFVGYNEFFSERRRVLAHLAAFVGTPERATDPEVERQVDEWIEHDLKHHSASLGDLVSSPGLPAGGSELHLLLDLAVRARETEPGLRGAAVGGEISDALDAAAESAEEQQPARERGGAAPSPGRGQELVCAGFGNDLPAELDFVIVGAAHAGAALLCELLGPHPDVTILRGWPEDPLVGNSVLDAQRTSVVGLLEPRYSTGSESVPVLEAARRVAANAPDARLIMVVRDPIERAIAHHRVARSRGLERRPLRRALREALAPAAINFARSAPTETNAYLAWGEYGRIVDAYLHHVPREQLLILELGEMTRDTQGARRRLLELFGLREAPACAPVRAPKALSQSELEPALLRALRRHFTADALRLERATGLRVPWAEAGAELPTDLDPPAPGPKAVETTIIVAPHDAPAQTRELVESISAHTPSRYELILVSRAGAHDPALAELAAEHGARLLDLGEADDLLLGVLPTSAEEIVLMHGSCVVTHGWLSNLRAALHSTPEIAAVGPRSNSARYKQGGIWLEDATPEGVARFARSFNHRDSARWFDVEGLDPFAVLARRSALEEISESARDQPEAVGDISVRLRLAGFRLVCAGDTFVFNRGRCAAEPGDRGELTAVAEIRLVRDGSGRVYELAGEVAYPIVGGGAQALIAAGRSVEPTTISMEGLQIGPRGSLCRLLGTDEVWLLHRGERRRVVGDHHRIRRLAGIAMASSETIHAFAEGSPVQVEDGVPPVHELRPLLSARAAEIRAERLAGIEELLDGIAAALDGGNGFGLIRLGSREALLLAEGAWPDPDGRPGLSRLSGRPTPAELRRAIIDADAVGLSIDRSSYACAPLLERLMFHFDIYPPLRFSSLLSYGLLGFDPASGAQLSRAPLVELLSNRPVAVVGPLGDPARQLGFTVGLDVRLAVALDRPSQLDTALGSLASARDCYDAVLLAGVPSLLLAPRLARELDVVALELGHALDRLLYQRHQTRTAAELEARWAVERYLREVALPPPDEPHEFEGELVSQAGENDLFYVERGRARKLGHRRMSVLFDRNPVELSATELLRIPVGVPVVAVSDGGRLAYVLVDGRKVRLQLGVPITHVDSQLLAAMPEAGTPMRWLPPAPKPPPKAPPGGPAAGSGGDGTTGSPSAAPTPQAPRDSA